MNRTMAFGTWKHVKKTSGNHNPTSSSKGSSLEHDVDQVVEASRLDVQVGLDRRGGQAKSVRQVVSGQIDKRPRLPSPTSDVRLGLGRRVGRDNSVRQDASRQIDKRPRPPSPTSDAEEASSDATRSPSPSPSLTPTEKDMPPRVGPWIVLGDARVRSKEATSVTNNKRRGVVKGKNIEESFLRTGQKTRIEWDDVAKGPKGRKLASAITHFIGGALREQVPMKAPTFLELTNDEQDTLVNYITTRIDWDKNDDRVVKWMGLTAQSIYSNWKCKLHKWYKSHGEPYMPSNFSHRREEWEWLVEHFKSERYQKISSSNKKNRALRKKFHRTGSTPFGQRLAEHTSALEEFPILKTYSDAYVQKNNPESRAEYEQLLNSMASRWAVLCGENIDMPPEDIEANKQSQQIQVWEEHLGPTKEGRVRRTGRFSIGCRSSSSQFSQAKEQIIQQLVQQRCEDAERRFAKEKERMVREMEEARERDNTRWKLEFEKFKSDVMAQTTQTQSQVPP